MRVKHIIIASVALIALTVIAAALYASLVLLKPERMKQLLIEQVQLATGRTLSINGDFTPSLSLTPTLAVSQIRLSNVAWGKAPDFIQAETLRVRFDLLPLLRGSLEIAALEIDGAQIWLEQQDDARNWQMNSPMAASSAAHTVAAPAMQSEEESAAALEQEPPSGGLTIKQFLLTNAKLHFQNLRSGEAHQLPITRLTLSQVSADAVEAFELSASYREAAIKATGSLAQQVLQLELNATTKLTSASVSGSLSLLDWVFDAALALESSKLSELAAFAGSESSNDAPLKLKAALGGTATIISISSLDATYDGQTFSGQGKIDLSQKTPLIEGQIAAKQLDFRSADVQESAQATPLQPSATITADSAQTSNEVGVISREPLSFDALSTLNAALLIRVESLQLDAAALNNLHAKISLDHGVLNITDISAGLAEGTLSASLRADATTSPPSLSLDISSKQLMLGALLPDLDEGAKLEGGRTNATLSLRGQGNSLHGIASTAQGHSDMLIEGTRYTPAARLHTITSFLNILRGSSSSRGKPVEVTCGIAQFDIASGVATSKSLLVQSPSAIVTGTGTLNLADETMRMQMRARSLLLGLADVTPALIISGSWIDPSVSLSAEQTLLNLGKMALGAVSGVGLVAVVGEQFTDRLGITADNNPCMQSLQDAANADADPKATAKQAEDNVRAIRDDIKGDLKGAEQDIKALRDGLKGLIKP